MHPSEFKGFAEHLVDMYGSLHDEAVRLRKENKCLQDEITRLRNKTPEIRGMVQRPLKMGSDWCINGDLVVSLSLAQRFRFSSPICNVRISPAGKIAFTTNKHIILYANETFFAVDETIHEFDPASMCTDLSENYRCIFEFDGEDLITFYKNRLKRFSGELCKWEFPIVGVFHIVVSGDLLCVGTVDGSLLIIRDGECLKRIDYDVSLRFFTTIGSEIIGFTDTQIMLVKLTMEEDEQPKRIHLPAEITEQSRIFALTVIGANLYYGGDLPGLRLCKIDGGLSVEETIPLKQPVVALNAWGQRLVVASQDKTVSIWDLTHKKCMRIITPDDVVDIAANENTLCCVDNSGALRVWQVSEKC